MSDKIIILLADDDAGFQEIVGTALKRNGFIIAEAHDGVEAIEKAMNLKPQLIIMDINMPNESGTEAVLDLVRNPETKDMKVIFLSSMKDPWPKVEGEASEVAKEIGVRELLNKTDDLDVIIAKVKEVLRAPAKQETPPPPPTCSTCSTNSTPPAQSITTANSTKSCPRRTTKN